jgi:predicted phage-related endonuclease
VSDAIELSPEEALQAEKRHSIGGSDAAVIALEAAGKKPPFGKSSFDVWLRLTGRAPEKEDTERLEMGRLLEEPIAQKFARRTGLAVQALPQVVHPQYPWATGHIDRAVLGLVPGDLEIKTVEFDPLGDWSQPGDEQHVPMGYFFQAVWYVGLPRDGIAAFERMVHMAAQFGLSGGMRVYRWWPDDKIRAIHARMFEACQRFYEDYVLKDEPPPMPTYEGAGDAAKRWLAYKHPLAKDSEIVPGTPQLVELVSAYEEAREKAAEWDGKKELLGSEIKRLVGDHYGMQAQAGGLTARATWAYTNPQTKAFTDYEAILSEIGCDVPAELIQKHTRIVTTRQGFRSLRATLKK